MLFMESQITADLGTEICVLHMASYCNKKNIFNTEMNNFIVSPCF